MSSKRVCGGGWGGGGRVGGGEIAIPVNTLIPKYYFRLMLESQSDYKAVLRAVDDTVTRILHADRAALFLVDEEGKNLYAQVFSVSKEDEQLVTLDHLETTSFENYLNQLGRKPNIVRYKGSNVAYDKKLSSTTRLFVLLIFLCPLFSGFPWTKVWWAIQLELGSYRMSLMQRATPTSVLKSMN